MNALPIIIGLGAILVLTSSKSEPSKKVEKDKPSASGPGSFKMKQGEKQTSCTDTQYINAYGKCQTFWDHTTEKKVIAEITKEFEPYSKMSWDQLCQNKIQKNGYSEPQTSPYFIQIMKIIVPRLWPDIKSDQLPPTLKSPPWVIKVWRKVSDVYYDQVCGIGNNLPPVT